MVGTEFQNLKLIFNHSCALNGHLKYVGELQGKSIVSSLFFARHKDTLWESLPWNPWRKVWAIYWQKHVRGGQQSCLGATAHTQGNWVCVSKDTLRVFSCFRYCCVYLNFYFRFRTPFALLKHCWRTSPDSKLFCVSLMSCLNFWEHMNKRSLRTGRETYCLD